MDGILGGIVDEVVEVEHWAENMWQERMVQVSVYAGIVFWFLSTKTVFKWVESNFPMKFGAEGVQILHAVVFAAVMYFGTRFLLDPIVKKIGTTGGKAAKTIEGMAGGGNKEQMKAWLREKCIKAAKTEKEKKKC